MSPDPSISSAARRLPLGLLGLGAVAMAVLVADQAIVGTELLSPAEILLYDGVIALSGVICLVRAAGSPGSRAAWIAFGLGFLAWAAGDLYWSFELAYVKHAPYPSLADFGYLTAIPCFFVGIALLTKRQVGHFSAASWLDGAIGALAAAAAATAVLAPALIGLTKGDTAAVLTNLAYPLGDLILIAFVVGALMVTGMRKAGPLLPIGVGLCVWTVIDAGYLLLVATDSYEPGWVDSLWPVGALIIASGACVASRASRRGVDRSSPILFPAVCATVAIAVLTYDHFERLIEPAVWLAVATLLTVVLRLALSFRENAGLVGRLRVETVTDALTGLGNRRQLFDHLEAALEDTPGPRRTLAIFDLDGFKHYNDSFGHPAGDALLRRLGGRLREAVAGAGETYRLGGDEFCIVVGGDGDGADRVIAAARVALSEQGDGFVVGVSCGAVVIPDAAATTSEAMRIADKAMYEEKANRSGRVEQQTRNVLLRILREREPRLSEHGKGVARLAEAMGRELALESESLDVLIRAAQLHDVGKIAIPEEVLHKPGPLDEIEWELIRNHTVIGERILGSAPAMAPVARAVRSSHERWDGGGYPDAIAGREIPLASRIIFICDAFHAMTSDREYGRARTEAEAYQELRRNGGSQFDPELVDLFCELRERAAPRPTALRYRAD